MLRSQVIPAKEAFSLDLQFTIYAKMTSTKDVKLNLGHTLPTNDVELNERLGISMENVKLSSSRMGLGPDDIQT